MNNFKTVKTYLSRYLGVVTLTIITLISGLVIWKHILPKYQEIQVTRDELAANRAKRDELTTYVAYLHELETTILSFEEEVVNYALPSENDVISLIVTYEGLAKTENMDVSPFDFAPGLIQSKKPKGSARGASSEEVIDETDASETQSKELKFNMEAETEKPETALDFIGKIHQARRVFTIKSLSWQNPTAESDSDKNIKLTFSLATYYYPSAPSVAGSAELVNKGKTQESFIASLNNTIVYDSLVLDTVEIGKEDFFTYDSSVKVPTFKIVPTPAPLEASPSAEITQ